MNYQYFGWMLITFVFGLALLAMPYGMAIMMGSTINIDDESCSARDALVMEHPYRAYRKCAITGALLVILSVGAFIAQQFV